MDGYPSYISLTPHSIMLLLGQIDLTQPGGVCGVIFLLKNK